MTPELITAIVAMLPTIKAIFEQVWRDESDFDRAWTIVEHTLAMGPDVSRVLHDAIASTWLVFNDNEVITAWAYLESRLREGEHITRAVPPSLDADTTKLRELVRHNAGGFDVVTTLDTLPPSGPPTWPKGEP